jgi:hypothetical protein
LLLIRPVILEDRTRGQNWLEFLQNELPEQLEDVPLTTRIAMCFQHYTQLVMQHLKVEALQMGPKTQNGDFLKDGSNNSE